MRAQVLGSVGAYGTGAGQLKFPSGLALDAERGALYVTDCLNHRVVAYDAALRATMLSFGRRGIADGDLSHPAGIALHDGDLFVADSGNSRVSAFRRDGTFIRSFGGEGDAAGRFLMPQGIVSAHGRLYVSDHSGRRLQTFTARGEPLQQVNFVRNLVRGLDRDEMLTRKQKCIIIKTYFTEDLREKEYDEFQYQMLSELCAAEVTKKRLPDEIDSLEKKIEKAEEARNTLVTKRAITNAANAISRRKKREADAVSTALGTPTSKRLKNRSKYAATPHS